jgi:hypothetical protein
VENQEVNKEIDAEFVRIVNMMTENEKVILREKIECLSQNPLYVDGQSH